MRARPSLSATVRARCLVQKEHWQERSVSSSARSRVSSSACKLPQWHREWKTGIGALSAALAPGARAGRARLPRLPDDRIRAESLGGHAHLGRDFRLFTDRLANRLVKAGLVRTPGLLRSDAFVLGLAPEHLRNPAGFVECASRLVGGLPRHLGGETRALGAFS